MISKIIERIIFLLSLFLFASCVFSQDPQLPPVSEPEPLIRPEMSVDISEGADASEPTVDFKTVVSMVKDRRRDSVTILHIGDSHVAGDFMTNALRSFFQNRLGDAGRGLISPPSLKGYHATGVDQEFKGKWNNFNSRYEKDKYYGLSGVIMQTEHSGATYSISTKKADSITFHLLSEIGGGKVEITTDTHTVTHVTRSSLGTEMAAITVAGKQAVLKTIGGGRVTVLGVDLRNTARGARYINIGLSGATGEVNKFWNRGIMRAQIDAIKPDLIIWSYGTNEGFDDNFKPEKYIKTVQSGFNFIKSVAPQADWVIVGAPDGQRKAGKGRECRDGWKRPPKLDEVNKTLNQLARDNDFAFFDWSKAMGGKCSMVKWISRGNGAQDHVHFKISGYEKSAKLLQRFLQRKFGI